MFKDVNDYVNFYANAGTLAGNYYGIISRERQQGIIDLFKKFVDFSGGVENFTSSQEAFEQFIRQSKGRNNGKRFNR